MNRSTTPPKVQFVPAHINIWAPQAQQHLLKQHGSKGSRPQSAHGTVHKGLPITAVSLQSAINFKNETRAIGQNSGRPTSAPVLTFARPDGTDSKNNATIEEAVKTLGPISSVKSFSDHQRPPNKSEHSKMQRPITPDFRGLHLSSLAQYSQKRPTSSQIFDRSAKFASSTSQQKKVEIETFDSGGDSDTETFAHTKLASANSRPSSSSSKHGDHSKLHRPDFGCVSFVLCFMMLRFTPFQYASIRQ